MDPLQDSVVWIYAKDSIHNTDSNFLVIWSAPLADALPFAVM